LLKQRNKFMGGILAGLALLCLGWLGWQQLRSLPPRHQGTVVISVDGKEQRLPLTINQQRKISTPQGSNLVVIKDGKVSVTQADCRDHICVQTGTICCPGQTIACLPHKLLIYIEGK